MRRGRAVPVGYLQAIDAALAEYLNADPPPRVVTTGHSLGGALAVLAAAYIAAKHDKYREDDGNYTKRLLQTYVFAAPRVGDGALHDYFVNTLNYSAVQVKNTLDPVPCVPLSGEGWKMAPRG
jgi:predicted lipase